MKVRIAGMAWLPRHELGPAMTAKLRRQLTVVPKKFRSYGDDEPPKPVKTYVQTDREFGVPRAYFFSTATGQHECEWEMTEGSPIEVESLLRQEGAYAEQATAMEVLLGHFRSFDGTQDTGRSTGAILQGKTGFGKCLGLGTPVLMFDGTIKSVEDVRDGDSVMGPDSQPRRVAGTTRGHGEMYRVVPVKGDPWVCNDVHVLTLVETVSGDVVDIPLNEYLQKSKTWKRRHKLFQSDPVDFVQVYDHPVDPYFLGVWLGDGTKNLKQGVRVTTVDAEILECLEEQALRWGAEVKVTHQADRCPTYRIVTSAGQTNQILVAMRKLFSDGPEIPQSYLTGSRKVRMEVLAGIVDTDGHLATRGSTIDIIQKDMKIADGIAFLARSLGFRVTRGEKVVGGARYQRLLVSGDTDQIPVRLLRKKAAPRRQKKNHRRTGFTVEHIGRGEYAGFTLDRDGRFLLGDFTVTHNTNTALAVAHALGRTTMIIVHKEFLLRQWVGRIKKFMPTAKVGIVQQDECEFEGCDFVVAMVHSLSNEAADGGGRYPPELWTWPGMVILDEVHRIGAPTWSPVPQLFPARYRLGLTATPRRKDGLDKVFWWNLGNIEYEAQTKMPTIGVRKIYVTIPVPGFLTKPGISPSVVENKLTTNRVRNRIIVDEIVGALRSQSGRKIMVLSKRLEHLRILDGVLKEECERLGVEEPSTGFYVGAWYTGEWTFSAAQLKSEMSDENREKLIAAIYRHFRRKRDKQKKHCAERRQLMMRNEQTGEDEEYKGHVIRLYNHGYRELVLEEKSGRALLALAKDYDISQKKSVEKKKARTEEELYEAERARVVWATYQMCAEGVDIPAIDTLVWAMPVGDIEQAAGRGRRFCVPKRHGGLVSKEDCEHFCSWRADTCEGKAPVVAADIVNLRLPMEVKRERYRDDFYDMEEFPTTTKRR